MDKKTIVIICLAVALAVVSWIAFKPSPEPYDKELIEQQVKKLNDENSQLKTQNIGLKKDFDFQIKKTATFEKQADSLQNLKPKIKYVYLKKYEAIDHAGLTSNDSLLRASLGIGK